MELNWSQAGATVPSLDAPSSHSTVGEQQQRHNLASLLSSITPQQRVHPKHTLRGGRGERGERREREGKEREGGREERCDI